MAGGIINLDDENFDEKISKGDWIVDFWAEWCAPCRIMAPHFEAIAKEFKGKINFAKVNVEVAHELTERFEIFSIPTTIYFRNGKQLNRVSGAMPKEAILEFIKGNQ